MNNPPAYSEPPFTPPANRWGLKRGDWVRTTSHPHVNIGIVMEVRQFEDPMELDLVMLDVGKGNGAWMVLRAREVKLLR